MDWEIGKGGGVGNGDILNGVSIRKDGVGSVAENDTHMHIVRIGKGLCFCSARISYIYRQVIGLD